MSRTEICWDDLSDEPNTVPATVVDLAVGYQGIWYLVDVSEATFKIIDDLMASVQSRCRRVPPGTAIGPSGYVSKINRTAHGRRVRDWARKRDWPELGDTGQIPIDAVDAYNKANPSDYYERNPGS